jgi:hypothetical protein
VVWIHVQEDDALDTNPLVLWEPPEGVKGDPVRVDKMLTYWLRPHQREGVAFMFECVTGLRKFDGHGCILADDMGLGKTLQVVYSQGTDGRVNEATGYVLGLTGRLSSLSIPNSMGYT